MATVNQKIKYPDVPMTNKNWPELQDTHNSSGLPVFLFNRVWPVATKDVNSKLLLFIIIAFVIPYFSPGDS